MATTTANRQAFSSVLRNVIRLGISIALTYGTSKATGGFSTTLAVIALAGYHLLLSYAQHWALGKGISAGQFDSIVNFIADLLNKLLGRNVIPPAATPESKT